MSFNQVECNSCGQLLGLSVFSSAISGVSGAIAASALRNPVGATGGAAAGVIGVVAGIPIQALSERIFGESPMGKVAGMIVSAVGSFFAQVGISMGIAKAMGTQISFGSACVLAGTTIGIALPIIIGVGCCLACCVLSSANFGADYGEFV